MNNVMRTALLAAPVLAGSMFLAMPAQTATCIGYCGKSSDLAPGGSGDVVPAPGNFGAYDWISTFGGVMGAARIGAGYSVDATNGSELISDSFFGSVGQTISFDFNYVTSDGSGFADYAFAQLLNVTTGASFNLFTARTDPTNPIVPGLNMPPLGATLSPGVVLVKPGSAIDGGPVWEPLGDSSGSCYDEGCGLSGWVHSTYTLTDTATYQLRFGVANWNDTSLQSGLAFSGLVIDGAVIGDGSDFGDPLQPTEVDPVTGAFEFQFEVSVPNPVIVIDPWVAIGYDYVSDTAMLSVQYLDLGDSLYKITFNNGTTDVTYDYAAGTLFKFTDYVADGVFAFSVWDIDETLGLDPANPIAFESKIQFSFSGVGTKTINVTQTPVQIWVDNAVPEPTTWAMMISGMALVGATMRRRRMVVSFA